MPDTPRLECKHRPFLFALAALGLATFVIGLATAPQRAWANLLLCNYYFLLIALFGVFFIALQYLFRAGWAVVFRRLPEAMSAYLPIGAVAMLAIFLGRFHLYEWSRPELVAANPRLQHLAPYLNPTFFLARLVFALAAWVLLAHLLRAHSRRQDADGDFAHTRKNPALPIAFLLLLALTIITSSVDWIMSLEPKWYSTMFPVYCSAGMLLGGSAALSVFLVGARRRRLLPGLNDYHLYELSRIICATSTFWAYIWFSQFMLIYYTNLPEEAVYFSRRLHGVWSLLFFLNPLLNWFLPVLMLLSATARRSPRWLLRAALLVLVGRWLDLYLLIMPALGSPLQLGLTELFIFAGFLALFMLAAIGSFRSAAPVPARDPYLAESVELRV